MSMGEILFSWKWAAQMPVILMSAVATMGLPWAYVSQSASKLKKLGEMVKKHWSSGPEPAHVRVLALSLTTV